MFATKPGKNDPNLLFGRMFLAGPAADLPHMLVGRLRPGFLSHLRPLQSGYDEPEILRYSNPTICLMIADREHRPVFELSEPFLPEPLSVAQYPFYDGGLQNLRMLSHRAKKLY